MEEGSDTAFWKDAHNTYRQDNSELTYSQNDFFRRVKVISLKERSSPSNYEKKYAFFLDDFGDVNASLYSLFEKIIHHKERKKSLSAFCIQFFSKEVMKKFMNQGLSLDEIKKQIFGTESDSSENGVVFNRFQLLAKTEDKNFERDLAKRFKNETIILHLQSVVSKYTQQVREDYINYMKRNLSSLIIKTREERKRILEQEIQLFRPVINFSLLEKKVKANDPKKFILLCNRYDKFYHYEFQSEEQKVIPNNEKYGIDVVLTLQELLFSFKQYENDKNVSQRYLQNKTKLLQKLFKHISWQLRRFQKYTRKGQKAGYNYKVTPYNILFNLEKQFFFLSPEPIIIEHFLGYKDIPTTPQFLESVERKKKLDNLFKAPQELAPSKFEKQVIVNTNVYRFMRILSSFDRLNMIEYLCFTKKEIFFNRKLDDSEDCRQLFGQFVHRILEKTYQNKTKQKYGPTLVKIMKGQGFQYNQDLPIEALTYRYWFKGRIAKLIIIIIQQRLKELRESKQENIKEKIKLSLFKLCYYTCLLTIIRKKQIKFTISLAQKKSLVSDFRNSLEKSKIEKAIGDIKNISVQRQQYLNEIKELRRQMQNFIHAEIYSDKNRDLFDNKNIDGSSEIDIIISNPFDRFKSFYDKGKVLFEKKLFNCQDSERIIYELLGRVNHENIEWAISQVYHKLLYERKELSEKWYSSKLQKIESLQLTYL